MTLRIQARRAAEVSENELVYIGELFYDDVKKRFGVFTNEDATTIRWLPSWVDDKLALNYQQALSGIVATGELNTIAMDFSSSDSVKFINTITNETYMEITPNGVILLKVNDTITEIAGTSNLAINGNLSVLRNVGAESSFTTSIDGWSSMFAPNWYVYSYTTSAGMLTASIEESDISTPDLKLNRAMRITTSGVTSNCGLRSFFFDYKFVEGRFITVTFRVKGPAGFTASTKVLSETDATLATKIIHGTGNYETISYPCYIPPSSSAKWWAVDLLFEPGQPLTTSSSSSTIPTEWLVGGLQVNLGTTPGIHERRSTQVEKALVNTLYTEGRVLLANNSTEFPVTIDSFVAAPNKVETEGSGPGVITISDMDVTGFNVANQHQNFSHGIVKYAAFIAPSPTPDF